MSFIGNVNQGSTYAPGYFIAQGDENVVRETKEIPQSLATTTDNGTKYVKMGTPFPSNDGNIEGFVYEDVDVTTGNMPGSVVLSGRVYESRIPVNITSTARAAIENLNIELIAEANESSVTRPY